MPKSVDARDNGHTAKSYGNPLGIECEACKRRSLVPLDRLGTLEGNMRPTRAWPFKCTACGSREVALWLFAKRAEADAWRTWRPPAGRHFERTPVLGVSISRETLLRSRAAAAFGE